MRGRQASIRQTPGARCTDWTPSGHGRLWTDVLPQATKVCLLDNSILLIDLFREN